jgi:hypothetical protein
MNDQRGGIFSTIRENVHGFAGKVPSASQPKAPVTSARKRSSTQGEENSSENHLLQHPSFSPDLEPSDYYFIL